TRIYNQEIIMKTNVNSFYDLLAITKKNRAVMVYASSAATYGSLPSPQIEGNENPDNPYGFSKYIMDQIASQYSKENPNLTIVGLRFFNVYGPREYYKDKTSSMVIQLGHQILSGKAPRLFKGSDKILRDFINIEDVLQANIKACKPIKNGIYNVGTGNPRSFQDIADILQQELETDLGTEYISNPYDGYQMHTQADIRASKSNLGFDPVVSLEEGIKTYIPEIKRLHGTYMS
ncbi:NAD-dependent epimerase/dehydratase family protein, partial [Candidatus Pseudothioglobus singularis]|nr:NAD-dependent epimerase/dehydratase family protein [Candidatus Pseudothioglobus singularis]